MSVLDKPIVLSLNAQWLPIGTRSVKESILAMNSINRFNDDRAAIALDIQYAEDENGNVDFSKPIAMIPTSWNLWVDLPVLPHHDFIQTVKQKIRAPTVVISPHYHKMPVKTFRPSKRTIYDRDAGICQYSGEKLSYSGSSLDHYHPKSKGGKDTFENLVLCSPKINFKKGDKTAEEVGLKLLRKPKSPLPTPAMALITVARHHDWSWFLAKNHK